MSRGTRAGEAAGCIALALVVGIAIVAMGAIGLALQQIAAALAQAGLL